jgi:hypothetical protein
MSKPARATSLGCALVLLACAGPAATPSDAALSDANLVDASDAGTIDAGAIDAATSADAGAPRVEHVVVVGIDGLGGEWMNASLAPTLAGLAATGAHTTQMQNALPTTSSTNWMSMISGVNPELHGVYDNDWEPGDSTPPPTLFRALREARADATTGVFHEWTGFGRLIEAATADEMTSPGDADATMDAAIAFARERHPDLIFVHLDLVDHAGHASGWGSPAYEAAVTHADTLVAGLRDALEEEGLWSTTALVVSADHGGVGLSHGDDTVHERSTPFFVAGPGIEPVVITREVRIWDIAPTVTRLLDVPAPAAWIASPIIEAFGGLPASSVPTDPLELRATSTYEFAYDESGTGALAMVSVWHPLAAAPGDVSLGDVALDTHAMPTTMAWTTRGDAAGVRAPVGYEQIWNDGASGGSNDGSLWSPIPALGFVCLGDVAVAGYTPPPLDAVRCVHQSYVATSTATHTWSDRGSGATLDGSVWSCSESTETTLGTFYARRHEDDDAGTNRCHALLTSRVVVR